jgi:hypothetical protein
MTIKKYFKELATGNEVSSLRKFVTLIVTGIFLITQVLIVFFCFYLILTETKGQVDKDLLDTLKVILQYDFYIILVGLGFITGSDLVRVMISKGFNPTPPPDTGGWGFGNPNMNTPDEIPPRNSETLHYD